MNEQVSDTMDQQDAALQRVLMMIMKYPVLTQPEQFALLRQIRRGAREPLDRVINANLRRVVKIAGEYLGQGLSLMDLIAEGTLGLITAARRFDERRGSDFTGYAQESIRTRIQLALAGVRQPL